MSAFTPARITTVVPRTPARDDHDKDPTPPSSATLGSDSNSKHDTFSTDDEGDLIAPAHPFLAYGRRVRTFSSPLKVNRAKYLLTFADAAAAKDWWAVMQQEFPDSVRESSQLFSFKGDRVPAKAWENPRFEHLKDRWSFRQLDDKENHVELDKLGEKIPPSRPTKRRSLMRMISTPTLGTIGEMPQSQTRQRCSPARSPAHLPEDPFTGHTPPKPAQAAIDFAELNRMLERMQMMMNQTQLRIDVLSERQHMYLESLDRLQTALEANSTHIQALATQDQLGAIATKNMRAAIEQNASHMSTILQHHVDVVDREQQIDNKLQACSQRLDEVVDCQNVARLDMRELRTSDDQIMGKVHSVLSGQRAGEEKLDRIMVAMEHASINKQTKSHEEKSPSHEGLQSIQDMVEHQSTQLAGLLTAQRAGNKQTQKLQFAITQVQESQDQMIEQRIQQLQSAHENEIKQLKLDLYSVMNEKMEQMQAQQKTHYEQTIKAISRAARKQVVQCDHDVAPPPRKMNKEVLGYWYKRPQ